MFYTLILTWISDLSIFFPKITEIITEKPTDIKYKIIRHQMLRLWSSF